MLHLSISSYNKRKTKAKDLTTDLLTNQYEIILKFILIFIEIMI